MLTLDGDQNVHNAVDLRQTLLEAIQPGETGVIDIAAVANVDLSFVQLIEAARTHATHLGGTLTLTAPAPPTVMAVLSQAGLLNSDTGFWTLGAPLQ